MNLHPKLADAAWPYDESDDGCFDPHALIVFAEDAQRIIEGQSVPLDEVLDDLMAQETGSDALLSAVRSNHRAALRALDAAGYKITKELGGDQ